MLFQIFCLTEVSFGQIGVEEIGIYKISASEISSGVLLDNTSARERAHVNSGIT
jgi:hypothetical protein